MEKCVSGWSELKLVFSRYSNLLHKCTEKLTSIRTAQKNLGGSKFI